MASPPDESAARARGRERLWDWRSRAVKSPPPRVVTQFAGIPGDAVRPDRREGGGAPPGPRSSEGRGRAHESATGPAGPASAPGLGRGSGRGFLACPAIRAASAPVLRLTRHAAAAWARRLVDTPKVAIMSED